MTPKDAARVPGAPNASQALTVSGLNRLAREALERALPLLWIGGEISNLTRAASGHIYFTLKDDRAQVRCTMWRNRAQLLPFQLQHGEKIEVHALATLYEARGDFQLSVESVRQAGLGSLYEAFLRLRDELMREGLFDSALKRPIPRYPHGIGVVTSLHAAALRDVLATLRRRAPGVPVFIYPAAVQGEGAPQALAAALSAASRRASQDGIETLLLVRGGGSVEDLWAFNDAALARAIRGSSIPVVTGIGHETDSCIADFAADLRAATPTAAAELATAGLDALRPVLSACTAALERAMHRKLERTAQRLDQAQMRLVHPRERLARIRDRIAVLRQRLDGAQQLQQHRRTSLLDGLSLRLAARQPAPGIARRRVDELAKRLSGTMRMLVSAREQQVRALAASVEHLGPKAVLARGYSITRNAAGQIVTRADALAVGDEIDVELASGALQGVVKGHRP